MYSDGRLVINGMLLRVTNGYREFIATNSSFAFLPEMFDNHLFYEVLIFCSQKDLIFLIK